MGRAKNKEWNDARKKFMETPGVLAKLTHISDKYGFSVKELVDLIGHESSFNSKSVNKKSKATGLIQFMPRTAKDLGTTTSAIKKMDILGQLDYVDKYFKRNHRKGAHPYMTVAYPKAGSWDPHRVIAGKNSKIAKQNPGWVDVNGNVTRASIENFVDPDGQDVYDPKSKPKSIPDKEKERDKMIKESSGTLATNHNVDKVLSGVNFIYSTIDDKVFDELEDNVKKILGEVQDPINDRTTLQRMARKFVQNQDPNELEREYPTKEEVVIDTPKEEVIIPETNEAAEGGIQPNGRVSTFTREEDIAAQDNTYKSLNIF